GSEDRASFRQRGFIEMSHFRRYHNLGRGTPSTGVIPSHDFRTMPMAERACGLATRSWSPQLADLNDIVISETLSVAAVHMAALSSERWATIGNHPLEQELLQDTKFFPGKSNWRRFFDLCIKAGTIGLS